MIQDDNQRPIKRPKLIEQEDFPSWLVVPQILSAQQLEDLSLILNIENQTTIPSHVFNPKTRANTINKHLRSSRKIEYRDKDIFNWFDEHLLPTLGTHFQGYKLSLIRNDIEVVEYQPGDFFLKHQDYVNFDSNEFCNYTFLICLDSCKSGGETVLHPPPNSTSEKPHVIDCTAKSPGSLVLFQKTTIHEGLPVEEGIKRIIKGNLLCFRSGTIRDYLIVNLSKSPGETWTIPADLLESRQPTCVYSAFYSFSKRNNHDQHIFHYTESVLTSLEFGEFYKALFIDSPDMMNNLKKALEYTGFARDVKIIRKFTKWAKSNDFSHFTCGLRDYYELLSLALSDTNILPFQMITIEAEDNQVIAWAGVGGNNFLTCDLHKSKRETIQPNEEIHYTARDVFPRRDWKYLLDAFDDKEMGEERAKLWNDYGLTPFHDMVVIKTGVSDEEDKDSDISSDEDGHRNYLRIKLNDIRPKKEDMNFKFKDRRQEEIQEYIEHLVDDLTYDHQSSSDGYYFLRPNTRQYSVVKDISEIVHN
eukprot:TRINITY_DN4599_c0_g1_i1.p1 TRINITY_DN4599_c0_g1~~TRINITY_DN4599_c0_g1_i1.p1  ORF type:complete len:531 (+),score=95.02 TRINITY_DN4599_c0_g1_i1:66-1658(+)